MRKVKNFSYLGPAQYLAQDIGCNREEEVVGIYHTMDNFTGRKKDAEHGKGNN